MLILSHGLHCSGRNHAHFPRELIILRGRGGDHGILDEYIDDNLHAMSSLSETTIFLMLGRDIESNPGVTLRLVYSPEQTGTQVRCVMTISKRMYTRGPDPSRPTLANVVVGSQRRRRRGY
jgi:hypothetical protein